jgi:transposase
MEFVYYIGCDVSKNELDFAVYRGNAFVLHQEIENDSKSIDGFFKSLRELPGFELSKTVVCMEHTGIYNTPLLEYLHKKQGNICLESALQIKNSQGNVRGKNDKIDSIRIAEYAYTFREKLKLWQPKREVIQQLARFSNDRTRLLSAQKMLQTPLNESEVFSNSKLHNASKKLFSNTLKSIKTDLEKVDKAIKEVIKSDEELSRLFGIITSVTGIGEVTAVGIIVTTNEFKDIKDSKKYACYAGVAPFVRESGVYRGKGRVSAMANKAMKTLLHMASLSAIRYNESVRVYYERKVAAGKNKMSVLNAVRNKLIHSIFACVNQNRKYNKIYTSSLV